jgi:TRAP-type C4-dicarboxylate transport system permease small subunit
MISFLRLERAVTALSNKINWIAAFAVVFIMLLTTADVVLRMFRHPIPGTYEIVGFSGSLIIGFSLAYTFIQKGHIAVEILVQRLPWLGRVIINIINDILSFGLFGILSWQSVKYAQSLKLSGEVSPTIQMPTYPFVYGVAVGAALLCVVLLVDLIRQFKGAEIE